MGSTLKAIQSLVARKEYVTDTKIVADQSFVRKTMEDSRHSMAGLDGSKPSSVVRPASFESNMRWRKMEKDWRLDLRREPEAKRYDSVDQELYQILHRLNMWEADPNVHVKEAVAHQVLAEMSPLVYYNQKQEKYTSMEDLNDSLMMQSRYEQEPVALVTKTVQQEEKSSRARSLMASSSTTELAGSIHEFVHAHKDKANPQPQPQSGFVFDVVSEHILPEKCELVGLSEIVSSFQEAVVIDASKPKLPTIDVVHEQKWIMDSESDQNEKSRQATEEIHLIQKQKSMQHKDERDRLHSGLGLEDSKYDVSVHERDDFDVVQVMREDDLTHKSTGGKHKLYAFHMFDKMLIQRSRRKQLNTQSKTRKPWKFQSKNKIMKRDMTKLKQKELILQRQLQYKLRERILHSRGRKFRNQASDGKSLARVDDCELGAARMLLHMQRIQQKEKKQRCSKSWMFKYKQMMKRWPLTFTKQHNQSRKSRVWYQWGSRILFVCDWLSYMAKEKYVSFWQSPYKCMSKEAWFQPFYTDKASISGIAQFCKSQLSVSYTLVFLGSIGCAGLRMYVTLSGILVEEFSRTFDDGGAMTDYELKRKNREALALTQEEDLLVLFQIQSFPTRYKALGRKEIVAVPFREYNIHHYHVHMAVVGLTTTHIIQAVGHLAFKEWEGVLSQVHEHQLLQTREVLLIRFSGCLLHILVHQRQRKRNFFMAWQCKFQEPQFFGLQIQCTDNDLLFELLHKYLDRTVCDVQGIFWAGQCGDCAQPDFMNFDNLGKGSYSIWHRWKRKLEDKLV